MKTGFIIIDEAFDCCDAEVIAKMPILFDYIRQKHKFAIVISHDERIKKLYDTTIDVVEQNGGSLIVY